MEMRALCLIQEVIIKHLGTTINNLFVLITYHGSELTFKTKHL